MIGGMMNGFGFGWTGMILNLILTIGLIAGIVVLVIWLVRRFAPNQQGNAISPYNTDAQPTPIEILQSRYARGELTREQYQTILEDLS